ncbi:MAG: prepilin peptidase [Blautia sp.]|nr:prepilin peptidase [Lachnoclostridium sp.]MCM1210402.1 prepilin peptidase [Blautia sp.]
MLEAILFYISIFLFGIVIGSFLNVCIYRIPEKEDIVKVRSHCMGCGYQLAWYDLIPLFSYLFLRGRCRKCKTKLSVQYPLIEALNGCLYVLIVLVNGVNVESLLYCLLTSALIVLSVIDFRTYEIPLGINGFILALGLIRLIIGDIGRMNCLIGFFAVSVFLMILYYATHGRGIGGGDVKLMAVCGLVLGWKLIILAFFLGCIFGAVIHTIRMRISGEGHVLALGPYLSAGVFVAMLWGEQMIGWYLNFF